MKKILLLLSVVHSIQCFAVYEIGDAIPDLCWTMVSESQYCLNDASNKVRVLIYNTGWCPDCQREFAELSPRVKEFKGQPVEFVSLSGEGWQRGALPDTQFLKEWQQRYEISFPVAASPKDLGKKFFAPPFFIPRAVIMDKAQKLAFKQTAEMESLTVDDIFAEVRKLLR